MRDRPATHASGPHRANLKQVADQIRGLNLWHFWPVVVILFFRLELCDSGQQRLVGLVALGPLRHSVQPSTVPDVQRQFFADALVKFASSSRNLTTCFVM